MQMEEFNLFNERPDPASARKDDDNTSQTSSQTDLKSFRSKGLLGSPKGRLFSNNSPALNQIREELLVYYDKFGGFNEFIHKETDRELFLKLLLAGKERNTDLNSTKNEVEAEEADQPLTSPNTELNVYPDIPCSEKLPNKSSEAIKFEQPTTVSIRIPDENVSLKQADPNP